MILRIAYLRDSAYELDYHTRIGRRAGVTPEVLESVRAGAHCSETAAALHASAINESSTRRSGQR